MKLLLDENLSDRVVPQIVDFYPESAHVKAHGLTRTNDTTIWDFARQNGFCVVSKDADFHQRSLVFGHPPKLVFLRVGNCSTNEIIRILRANHALLLAFDQNPESSILILP